MAWNERFVRGLDGTRLYTRWLPHREKQGHTAVLCDGIACDGFIWRYLLDDLAPYANLLHWHYRGHGRSSRPSVIGDTGTATLTDDLSMVRASRRPPTHREILFGHSMGVQVVLEAYRREPERIAALVLICGVPGRVTHTFKGTDALAQTLPKLIEQVQRRPRIARALFGNVPPSLSSRVAFALGEVDSTVAADDLVNYLEHVANLDLELFLRMLRTVGEESAFDMLGEIEVPVLVLAGELDSFTPTHLAEEMAATIPDCELIVFPGATHVVPIERRAEVKTRVERFFEERLGLRPSGA
ncbi:MAG: alpha/beta hydrolase [Myxococcota bacterium]